MFPVLFNIGNFTLHTYGLLVAIGFLTGIYVARHFARVFGQDPERIFNLAVYLALAAIVGAKLFLVLQDWRYYVHDPGSLINAGFLESAGIFYGGLIAALVVLTLYVHRQKLSWLGVGDAVVPGVAIGHAIGRLGCFSAGCCWGKPTTLPWGITFTSAYSHATVGVPLNIRLQPTQLYGAAAEGLIFLLLWRMSKRRAFVGELTAIYLLSYGVARFLIDFARSYESEAMLFHGLMTDAQLTSLFMIAFAIGIWAVHSRRRSTAAAA
ncbi:MAG TPA: prolipoprotein diacylglyceryl transferase [Terriglobales bacterium]|nr:prolipoprotein diacylglyceryl transferase [Terriglobales bacterium]